jgi:protein-disulfide isomerase
MVAFTQFVASRADSKRYPVYYCRQFHTTVFGQSRKDYIDTGKLRFVSRDLPLDMHASAFEAAQAARCAGDQDRFWQMRDLLISHSDTLNNGSILTDAQQLGMSMARFESCLTTGKYLPEIRRDIADANSIGIFATPSFVLGKHQ